MRITGGLAKGIPLKTPTGMKTRPAVDSAREALFSSIADRVAGVRFVDLFAGTGAYGLEAWSRGASAGVFVEKDSDCVKYIQDNVLSVAKSGRLDSSSVGIIRKDVFKWQVTEACSPSLVFADPPYVLLGKFEDALFQLAGFLLKKDGLFILEHPANIEIRQPDWRLLRQLGKKSGSGPSVSIWEPDSIRNE
ncbi:MAG: methyltransferase [Opitutaceae bacterium]|nr:methyltransferase [Opitutaceae bacterium]